MYIQLWVSTLSVSASCKFLYFFINFLYKCIYIWWYHPTFYLFFYAISVQFGSVTQLCLTLCDPMKCSTPGLHIHHKLSEGTKTHIYLVGDAIQPSHCMSTPSPPALNRSQNQSLFKWISSLHHVAKVFEFQLQHQSFQWTPRTDLL